MDLQDENEALRLHTLGSSERLPFPSRALALTLLGLALLGCGGSAGSNGSNDCPAREPTLGCVEQSVDQCFHRDPSVGSGVYGCVTSTQDVGPPEPAKPFVGFGVQVFDSQPPPTPDDGLAPAMATQTDAMGFFELELTPGAHWMCTTFRRCVQLNVVDGATQSFNYDFGDGPGW